MPDTAGRARNPVSTAPRAQVGLVAPGKNIVLQYVIPSAIIKYATAGNFIKHVAEDGMSAQHVIEINRVCVTIDVISNMMEKIMPDDISLVVPVPTRVDGARVGSLSDDIMDDIICHKMIIAVMGDGGMGAVMD